jgi:hypothetical protein
VLYLVDDLTHFHKSGIPLGRVALGEALKRYKARNHFAEDRLKKAPIKLRVLVSR